MMRILAIALLPLLICSAAAADDAPRQLINERYGEIKKVIDTHKKDAVVRTKVTEVLESFTDFNEFGRLTLKKWWPELSTKQRSNFVSKYRKLIHRSYVKRFKANQKLTLSFRGETKVIKTRALVKTTVMSGKTEAEVDYKLLLGPDQKTYKAYDIVIDQVSLMRSYRKQFSRIMKKDGFKVLLSKMDKKIRNNASSDLKDP